MTVYHILGFAAVCAALSGWLFSNRTAWPLLGSLALCLLLRSAQVPFDRELWFEIDLVAILFIARRNMPRRDWIILALFVPAWISYALPDPSRFWGGISVVIAQLLLTIPLTKLQGIGGFVSHGPIREVKYGDAR